MTQIIIVTCSTAKQARAVESELKARQEMGVLPPDTLYVAVPDPSSVRIGSGGATLNALLIAEELLSKKIVGSIADHKVVLIHSGGDSQRMPSQSVCGKAWSALPSLTTNDELVTPFDHMVAIMMQLLDQAPCGLVVGCSDTLLSFPSLSNLEFPEDGPTGLAISMPASYGPRHGVYKLAGSSDSVQAVESFYQKASVVELESDGAVVDGQVFLDSGVIYFPRKTVSSLIDLARQPVVRRCTYMSVDSNETPIRIELYSDILMAFAGGMGRGHDGFLGIEFADSDVEAVTVVREALWQEFQGCPLYAYAPDGAQFAHVGTTPEYLALLTEDSSFRKVCGLLPSVALGQPSSLEFTVPEGACVLNTLLHSSGTLGCGSVVEHSELWGSWSIGAGSLVSAVRSFGLQNNSGEEEKSEAMGLQVLPNTGVQETHLLAKHLPLPLRTSMPPGAATARVLSVIGVNDPIKASFGTAAASYVGTSWDTFFEITGCQSTEVWAGESAERTLWNASLFPVTPLPALARRERAHAVNEAASLWLQYLQPVEGPKPGTAEWYQQVIVHHPEGNVTIKEGLDAWKVSCRVSLK